MIAPSVGEAAFGGNGRRCIRYQLTQDSYRLTQGSMMQTGNIYVSENPALQSSSWRLGRMLRAQLPWVTGRREPPPRVTDWVQAAIIDVVQRSTTWEVSGLLRAMTGMLRRR